MASVPREPCVSGNATRRATAIVGRIANPSYILSVHVFPRGSCRSGPRHSAPSSRHLDASRASGMERKLPFECGLTLARHKFESAALQRGRENQRPFHERKASPDACPRASSKGEPGASGQKPLVLSRESPGVEVGRVRKPSRVALSQIGTEKDLRARPHRAAPDFDRARHLAREKVDRRK